jgi:hypothetical protein
MACLLNVKITTYNSIIFPVVLYGCEARSLTLWEEHRLRVFENRVLRWIFGPKTGDWRKLHNEELRDLYPSASIIRISRSRMTKWAEHVARVEVNKNQYRLLVGKPEGKIPLGRPRRRWVDNIKMNTEEMGWGDVDWIGLARDRDTWTAPVNAVLNVRVPYNAGKLSSGNTSGGLSCSAQLHS